jgi:hypothetical protein
MQLDPCGSGDCYSVSRNDHVILIKLWGEVTDVVNENWRRATQSTFDRDGYPPFGFVDAYDGRSVGSLQGKMRSADFMRKSAARMKRIALVGNTQGSFVIKAVMRVAGAANVELITAEQAPPIFDAMCVGRDPFAR